MENSKIWIKYRGTKLLGTMCRMRITISIAPQMIKIALMVIVGYDFVLKSLQLHHQDAKQ